MEFTCKTNKWQNSFHLASVYRQQYFVPAFFILSGKKGLHYLFTAAVMVFSKQRCAASRVFYRATKRIQKCRSFSGLPGSPRIGTPNFIYCCNYVSARKIKVKFSNGLVL